MPIQLTQLKGTDSISSNRITINDNFNILKDNLNDLISILDTNTGLLDNSTGFANGTIKTTGLTITTGNLSLNSGFINLGNSKLSRSVVSGKNFIITENIDGIEIPKKSTAEITSIKDTLLTITVVEDRPNILVFDDETKKLRIFIDTDFVDVN